MENQRNNNLFDVESVLRQFEGKRKGIFNL